MVFPNQNQELDEVDFVKESRFVVGIDLGTTNSALSYVDTWLPQEQQRSIDLTIPQTVAPGIVENRTLLPSYLYLPGPNEVPSGSLQLPWEKNQDYAIGEYARSQGQMVPTRLVNSAKSWLCHPGVNRKDPILPWKSPEGSRRVSPLQASTLYLKHLRDAWNFLMASDHQENRLENHDIVLTVPASFDASARELTVEAARAAGFEFITLLEEPQAAFYSWIDSSNPTDSWRKEVKIGDSILICDIGGGTTDLTLIRVDEDNGQLVLTRVAVGDHILLGGDNMDLALAHRMADKFKQQNIKLDQAQMLMLWHACRSAKEKLFQQPELLSTPVTVLGRSSRVIAGTIKGELTHEEVEKSLIEGFFPLCPIEDQPQRSRSLGFQELGLPYASDPAISRHIAHFLSKQAGVDGSPTIPSLILFNGGVFKASPLRNRVVNLIESWLETDQSVKVLDNPDLDQAVSRGAAYYGLVRRGKGVRIRGGTARAYYVGIETSIPAIPGVKPPIKALCVAPCGMEEGSQASIPELEFGLRVGEPAEFRFLGSSIRKNDVVGTLVEDWEEDEIEELSPIATTLNSNEKKGLTVPVHLQSKVTEIGTLEIWCLGREDQQRWKLEFNVRENE